MVGEDRIDGVKRLYGYLDTASKKIDVWLQAEDLTDVEKEALEEVKMRVDEAKDCLEPIVRGRIAEEVK
jgi:hypothetical protein